MLVSYLDKSRLLTLTLHLATCARLIWQIRLHAKQSEHYSSPAGGGNTFEPALSRLSSKYDVVIKLQPPFIKTEVKVRLYRSL